MSHSFFKDKRMLWSWVVNLWHLNKEKFMSWELLLHLISLCKIIPLILRLLLLGHHIRMPPHNRTRSDWLCCQTLKLSSHYLLWQQPDAKEIRKQVTQTIKSVGVSSYSEGKKFSNTIIISTCFKHCIKKAVKDRIQPQRVHAYHVTPFPFLWYNNRKLLVLISPLQCY